MPTVHCKICKNRFSIKQYWLRMGWGKYCSRECKNEGQKNGKRTTCFTCGKPVYRSRIGLQKSKSKKYFCSKSCQTIWRNTTQYIGSKHLNWKGGLSSYYYRSLLKRTSRKERCGLCGVTDKRILAVHHKDRNHLNNKIDNLIWLCHNCHFLTHHLSRARI